MLRVLFGMLLFSLSGAGWCAGFVALRGEVKSAEYRELARELDQSGLLADIAKELNGVIALKVTLGLRFAECGEANAYYDAETREVSVCYELIESYYESMADTYDTEDELDDAVAGAFLFVFFHEIGHALVDVLDVPITGREEDAVDQLSAWVLLDGEEGDKAVLDAAISFYAGDEAEQAVDQGSFADEHSLDQQRFYNMICWVYGSDPEGYAVLVDDGHLPAGRAERCEGEYAQLDRSWTRLLKSHLKP
ncbi:MAG TPA: DUF4344 domain-containing metallopeptidase [Patescibacteria group bacterium]|nr:DUF4344 domain-containing metallopeptidase [Patescibacteria group bacterium]